MKSWFVSKNFKNVLKNPAQLWRYILISFSVFALVLFSLDAYIFYRNTKIKRENVEPFSSGQILDKSTFENAVSILQKTHEFRESIEIPSIRNPFKTQR